MASYPTSIFAPSAKNTGDTVQAAHVNDLDNEVVAVETGLRNGLQHALTISTGGLTVSTGNTVLGQNLSVAGASSVATLHASGDSTFAGAVAFTGAVTGLPMPAPTVRLGIGADQNLASAQWTGINWIVETYDTHGMHSTSANSSRLVFADSTGVYHLGCSINPTNASSGAMLVRILIDDSTTTMVAANGYLSPTAINIPVAVSGDYRATSTASYATVQVYNGGASSNSVTSTGSYVTAVWAHKVSS